MPVLKSPKVAGCSLLISRKDDNTQVSSAKPGTVIVKIAKSRLQYAWLYGGFRGRSFIKLKTLTPLSNVQPSDFSL